MKNSVRDSEGFVHSYGKINKPYIVRYNKKGETIIQKDFAKKETALNFAKIKVSKGYKVSFGKKG
jgi:hypothetical protein